MLKKLSETDKRVDNIHYLLDQPLNQTRYNHPFYANRTSYPAGPHFIQPTCPSLPTPEHNEFNWNDMMRGSTDAAGQFAMNYFPSSVGVFLFQMMSSLTGLLQDIFKIDRNFTLNQIVHLLMIENRLFYIGALLIILFGLRYIAQSVLG